MTNPALTNARPETVAGFVGAAYPAFFLQFWPEGEPRAHLVYLPPFGEEMNRCRAIVTAQARWFASRGLSCSILDFFGTGESQGDLNDANLSIWRQNIDELLHQLHQRTKAPIYLWGCRLGGLVALNYIETSGLAVGKLLLWQPISSGKVFVTQLLRLKVAGMIERGESGASTTDLRARLTGGETLEVGGYIVGHQLLTALEEIEIASLKRLDVEEIFWLQHSNEAGTELTVTSQRAVSHLEQLGPKVSVRSFSGPPVWQLHKRDTCEDLLQQTRQLAL